MNYASAVSGEYKLFCLFTLCLDFYLPPYFETPIIFENGSFFGTPKGPHFCVFFVNKSIFVFYWPIFVQFSYIEFLGGQIDIRYLLCKKPSC